MQNTNSIHGRATESTRADVEFVDYWLPAHWASALINDDRSGMEDAEEVELDAWLQANGEGFPVFYCVNCSDESQFMWRHDATQSGVLAADCLSFTFQIR